MLRNENRQRWQSSQSSSPKTNKPEIKKFRESMPTGLTKINRTLKRTNCGTERSMSRDKRRNKI